MKPLFLLVLLVLVGCGGSGGGGTKDPQSEQARDRSPQSEDCFYEGCETIHEDDAPQIDLLESMIDVTVTVTPDEILFRESKESKARGRQIECESKVSGGDLYRYELRGDELDVYIGRKKYTMNRLNESTGLKGAWSWSGYERDRIYTIRSLTVINDSRVILKTHCEN